MTTPDPTKPLPKDIPGLLTALRDQKQCDMDGVECQVSRQAVDEAITLIEHYCRPSGQVEGMARNSAAYNTLEAYIAGGDELGPVSDESAIQALHTLLHALPVMDPDARPLGLKWGRHDGRGEYHIEWHAPCGCGYHPEPKPHVHPCIKHSPIEDA